MSHPNVNYALKCTFRGRDTQESLLVSRETEFPLSHKKFTVNDFLAHDIIKQSSAKLFKFYLKFQLRVVMDREWVVEESSFHDIIPAETQSPIINPRYFDHKKRISCLINEQHVKKYTTESDVGRTVCQATGSIPTLISSYW